MLKLIESRGCFLGYLLEANPDKDGTGDMVALDTCQTALTAFNASSLLGFAVKLLNFPAQGTHVSCILRGLLSKIVRGDIVRALRGKHQPEQFHAMAFGKILDMQRFAMLYFLIAPIQAIHSLIASLFVAVIHLAVILERAMLSFLQAFNVQHQLALGIPEIHPYPAN